MKLAILLVDHGSRRAASNATVECMARLVRHMAGNRVVVQHAHMEIAQPTVEQGFDACVACGAQEIIVHPYLLAPGRHAATDIPHLVEQAATRHPGIRWRVTAPLGVHPLLGHVVLERCNVPALVEIPANSGQPCQLGPDKCQRPWCRTTDDT